jgi:hypothetical protein
MENWTFGRCQLGLYSFTNIPHPSREAGSFNDPTQSFSGEYGERLQSTQLRHRAIQRAIPGADIPRPEAASKRPGARAPRRFQGGPFRLVKGGRIRAPCSKWRPKERQAYPPTSEEHMGISQ